MAQLCGASSLKKKKQKREAVYPPGPLDSVVVAASRFLSLGPVM